MELSLQTFLIVCPLVFLAGFIDAIGGGGGLISLPGYLMAGIPPHFAIATNKLSSACGSIISTGRYVKNGYADFKLGVPGIIAAFTGAQFGARLALMVKPDVFKIIMLIALPVLGLYMFFRKDLNPDPERKPAFRTQLVIVCVVTFLIGMYDGFYGPGTGTFLIMAYTGLAGMEALTAGANTKLANLTSNLTSLVVFLMSGKVILPLGLTAAIFGIAGNYLGAGFAMKKGAKGIRAVVLVVIFLLTCKLFTEMFA